MLVGITLLGNVGGHYPPRLWLIKKAIAINGNFLIFLVIKVLGNTWALL